MLKAFVPRETDPGENRVGTSPDAVGRLRKMGLEVQVEPGAGTGSNLADHAFTDAGATLVDAATGWAGADLVLKLNPPSTEEIGRMKEGATLVSFLYGAQSPDLVEALCARKASCLAMELIPRITRAQKMDALSSQANIAGYKAVIMAAEHLPKMFPMLMTAAGTIHPAHVVILGAGVAGLQAIATAKRLGAVVEVSDVRPAVKEQVESLGGKYIEVPTDESAEDEGGYAKEQSEEFLQKQRALVRERIVQADVVISTAAIPGKKAPLLIPADMVADMKSGSVIVDLAVETGGNCELSELGQVVEKDGVRILGLGKVPSLVAIDATEMYARNIVNLLGDLVKDGELTLDLEDDVVQGALVTHQGQAIHPSVAPATAPTGESS